MGRILSIDYGEKRCGMAVSDILHITANALCVVATNEIVDFLTGYIPVNQIDTLVVGYPKHLNNTDSRIVGQIEIFIKKIQEIFPSLKIEMYDERFTSKIALNTLVESGVSRKKRQDKSLLDKIAATIILQDYLERNRQRSTPKY